MDRLVLQLNHLSDRLLMVAAGQGGQGAQVAAGVGSSGERAPHQAPLAPLLQALQGAYDAVMVNSGLRDYLAGELHGLT